MDFKGIIPVKDGTLAWVEIHDGDFRETHYKPSRETLFSICTLNNLPFAETMKMIDDAVWNGAYGILINIPEYNKSLLENSTIHLFYQGWATPVCKREKILDEWISFDHNAKGKICPDCQEKIGRSIR